MRVSQFLKSADKRTRKYKDVEFLVDVFTHKYGRESKELKALLDIEVVNVIEYEI